LRQKFAEMFREKDLGWKTLTAFVLGYALAWIGGAVWGLGATQVGRLLNLGDTNISLLSLMGVAAIRLVIWIPVTRNILKRRLLRDLAFPFRPGWWADLFIGVGITSIALGIVFKFGLTVGWLHIDGWIWKLLRPGDLLNRLLVSLAITGSVAILEEVVFRAYLLTGLKLAWGGPLGLAVMSICFTLIHTPILEGNTPFVIILALLFLTAFGLLFGLTYLRTGSIWLPVGIHFAWDFVESDLLNLSGDLTNPHIVGAITKLKGPSSLAGLGNAILIDALALAIISGGIWISLHLREQRLPTPVGADAGEQRR
jgi:membrane protease YdiL (CAAX protease family)